MSDTSQVQHPGRTALRPVDEVIEQLLQQVKSTTKTVTVPLDEALGKYLATDVVSPVNVPPAANSAMDGYAYNSADDPRAGETYQISDRIPAGTVGHALVPGTLVRIFTGAPVPAGADTVIMQEDTTLTDGSVRIDELPSPAANVRPMGQDIQSGALILSAGRRLRPEDLGLLASVGIADIRVYKPLSVAVLSTGDELVEPSEELTPGKIYNANRYALAGLLRQLGMEVQDLGVVADTPEATREALALAADRSDCIVSTGGVSVGEEDYVRGAVESLGSLDIWRLAIKPGKPLAFGKVRDTPFFGLPGNPVSTYVTFLIIARPYLIALQGGSHPQSPFFYGTADFEYRTGNRREYLRVKISTDQVGTVMLTRFQNQGSGIMSSVSWADALAEVDIQQEIKPGDLLKYTLI